MVLAYHLWPSSLGSIVREPFYRFGYVGVSFFFILSGFVLAYSYGPRVESLRKGSFYYARFARIYPVYLLGAVLTLIVMVKSSPQRAVEEFALTLPMIQAWLGERALSGNSVGWSISVEAFLYAVFPFVIPSFAAMDRQRTIIALAASAIVVVIPQLLAAFLLPSHLGMDSAHDLAGFAKYFPLLHLPEFLAGVALARLFAIAPPQFSDRRTDVTVLASAAFAWLLAMSPWRMPWPLTFTGGLVVPFCLIIFALASGQGAIARFLSLPTMVLLGEASYAMYILHVVIHQLTLGILPKGLGPLITIPIILLSVFVYRYFERPCQTALLRLAKGRQAKLAFNQE